MYLNYWSLWEHIYDRKQGRSLERWALRYLHCADFLYYLAKKIQIKNRSQCSIEMCSIWIDGTPQAHAIARSNKVKCELADLLYIVEEYDANNVLLSKKGLLLQGKNTDKHNKIDGGSSTQKERNLLEKLDRNQSLILKYGVKDSSKVIGSYKLGGQLKEGLSDCAKFLLMPKNRSWNDKVKSNFPFHITWPKNEKSSEMQPGQSLEMAINEMISIGGMGKVVVNPNICEWSRLVADLENGYDGTVMKGYGGQSRINHSGRNFFALQLNVRGDFHADIGSSELDAERIPYISILKVKIIKQHAD